MKGAGRTGAPGSLPAASQQVDAERGEVPVAGTEAKPVGAGRTIYDEVA